MGILEEFLTKVAETQKKYALPIMISVILMTVFLGYGATKISIESDINKEMPQDLPIYQLNDKITDTFGGQDTVILIFTLDESMDYKNAPKDIREPEIINYLSNLQHELESESMVNSVGSFATYISNMNFNDVEQVKTFLKAAPQLESFFSRDFKTTIMFVTADVGSSEEKIHALSSLISDDIKGLSLPAGVKVMQTGAPPMRVTIFSLLAEDALNTLLLAALIILLLLFVMEKSFTKGLLVFAPLTFGLIWTMGTLGWLGIKLSIATVGLGAMILGLGVEYGVFILTRYKEERAKGKNQLNSLKIAVPGVGSAILGSGATTIVGFMALTLSVMPMMQHLGVSLALGIFYCLFAAVFVAPVIIILEEKFEQWNTHRLYLKYSGKKDEHMRGGL
ncbi:MMPL family transporter [Candidatus Woesearchaeota archaeon]|nr:MMPL family transporter [Candidatus Woesearchaeota archaeon]